MKGTTRAAKSAGAKAPAYVLAYVLAYALAALMAPAVAGAQPMSRRAVTIPLITSFPAFFSGQPVVLRGEIRREGERVSVATETHSIPAFVPTDVSGSGTTEIRGEVWDIGRMQPDDFRLSGKDLRVLLGVDPAASWPRPGEMVVLNVTSSVPADPLTAPSLRNVALAPDRYVDQRVTIKGQFRGRNLFGDQPQAPPGGDGRREFVLRSADAAVWVTGMVPKGRGFTFDINSRLDTRRWLEVSGVVKEERGLVWIVAATLTETSPQADRAPEPITSSAPLPSPEVLFTAPTSDETDVALNTKVRVQFSRDLDTTTLKGNVTVAYSAAQATERGEPQAPGIAATFNYNRGTRVLEITFAEPLERFRQIAVTFSDAVKGTDGTSLKPYTLKFTLGG